MGSGETGEVTRDNARANKTGTLVRAVVADGLANPMLARAAPYDLLIANILAGPLTQLAPSIIRSLAPGAISSPRISSNGLA